MDNIPDSAWPLGWKGWMYFFLTSLFGLPVRCSGSTHSRAMTECIMGLNGGWLKVLVGMYEMMEASNSVKLSFNLKREKLTVEL